MANRGNNREFQLALIAVALLAFVVRVQVCHELLSLDPGVASPSAVTDMATYKTLSGRILDNTYEGAYYYQPFYYAVFLPVARALFGRGNPWGPMLLQCVLGSLTALLAGLSAYELRRSGLAGIAAALLVAFSSILILYTPYLLIATLQTFWMALLLHLCVCVAKRRIQKRSSSLWDRCVDWARVGLILGFAILTRGNAWLLLPGIVLAELTLERPQMSAPGGSKAPWLGKSNLLPLVALLLLVLIPQLPFAIRNTMITGHPALASTAGDTVLGLGNTPEAPPGGRDPGTGPGPMEYPETLKAWTADTTTPLRKRVLDWALSEPAAFAELQFRKLLLFWDYREIPNNVAVESQGLASRTLRSIGLFPMVKSPGGRPVLKNNLVPTSFVTLALALAAFIFGVTRLCAGFLRRGLSATLTRRFPELLTLYFTAALWFGVAAFYVLSRFRAPAIPVFAVMGGCFAADFATVAIKRRWRAATRMILSLAVSLFVVYSGYDIYRFLLERKIARVVRPNGTLAKLNGHTIIMRDNGPMSFGGWRLRALRVGDKITKRFAVPSKWKSNTEAEFSFDIFWGSPGVAKVRVNGIERVITTSPSKHPGRVVCAVPIPLPSDGTVTIEVESTPPGAHLALDLQRSYGRTMWNSQPTNAELVSRLKLTRESRTPAPSPLPKSGQ